MKCVICGKEIKESLYANKILCSSECFDEDFWNDILDKDAIIVNGECYHDAGYVHDMCDKKWLGHGGRLFNIEMNDGRVIKTNNLWYNGEVPINRNVKDNAKFI